MTDRPFRRLLGLVRRVADADGQASDERLLERFAAAGDEAAFELLVWRHGAMVLGVCRRVLGDAHAAEDAFQATFLALARRARAVRRGAAVAGWLHRVARRVAARARHTAARRAWHERRAIAISSESAAGPADDLRAVLDEELDRLPARLRLPVVLCYLEGRSTAEAARRLGCPRGTVLSRLAAARTKLRARLTRRGLAPAAGGLAALAGSADAPAALVATTARVALAFAAGRTGVAGPAPQVIALTEGVLRAMIVSKLKLTAAVVLAVGVIGTGIGLAVRPLTGPGRAFAEAPQAPGRAEEKKGSSSAPKPATDDRRAALELAEKLREELAVAEAKLEDQEEKWARDRVEARLKLAEAEERLKQLERELAPDRQPELTQMRTADEEISRLRVSLNSMRVAVARENDPAVQNHKRKLDEAEKAQKMLRDKYEKWQAEQLGKLLDARRAVVDAEEQLFLLDRRTALRRRAWQSRVEEIQDRLYREIGLTARSDSAEHKIKDLERKLDEVLKELSELRRELRK
jgi:RNA polymerase sigma factor (sigma-70 family)